MSSFLNAGQAACTVTTKRQAPPLPSPTIPPRQAPRMLDQLREQIRYLHYSMSTEDAYVHWCKAFILFHGKQHPKDLGGAEVEAFLTWLANERQVAPATHKQALSALLFFVHQGAGHEPAIDAGNRPPSGQTALARCAEPGRSGRLVLPPPRPSPRSRRALTESSWVQSCGSKFSQPVLPVKPGRRATPASGPAHRR